MEDFYKDFYKELAEELSKGDYFTINGKPINLKELNDFVNGLQEENDNLKNRLENAVADCNLRLQENERLKSAIKRAKDRLIEIENKYGYILDDVVYMLDKENKQ